MISFESVDLSFNEKQIFREMNLQIKQGEKIHISGRSGIGKSSLFSLLLGFIFPSKGNVFIKDIQITEHTAWKTRQQVAYVSQDIVLPAKTVADSFAFVSHLKANSSSDFSRDKIAEMMEFFELDDNILNSKSSELSGGERQRIGIIIACLLGRDAFLLDEATSALDIHLKKKTADYFLSRDDWTVLTVSHDTVWAHHEKSRLFDLEAKTWVR